MNMGNWAITPEDGSIIHMPQILWVLNTHWRSGHGDQTVNKSESLCLCPNIHREQSGLGSLKCVTVKPERIQRGFVHLVLKAPMSVPKPATAAQARGFLIQADLR